MKLSITLCSLSLCSLLIHSGYSFLHAPSHSLISRKNVGSESALGFFGKKSENPGQSNDSQTFNGKPIKAKVGEKVSVVAKKAKIPVTYSCRKGDCGTCEIMMNGLIVKACQEKIPSGKCVIKTF